MERLQDITLRATVQAQKRYEKVGGQALREFNRDSESYI